MAAALSEALFPLDLRDASLLVPHLPGRLLLPSACGLTSPPHLSTLDHPRANTAFLSPQPLHRITLNELPTFPPHATSLIVWFLQAHTLKYACTIAYKIQDKGGIWILA